LGAGLGVPLRLAGLRCIEPSYQSPAPIFSSLIAEIAKTGRGCNNWLGALRFFPMKRIEAIIKPFRLEDVKDAVAKLGIDGMTMLEVQGCGHQRGHTEFYQGNEYTSDFLPKLKIDLIVADPEVEAAVNAIVQAAKTGKIGDGKIFISIIDNAVRIRTGEKGEMAL
jgi:nitrogen regulatory protein PII